MARCRSVSSRRPSRSLATSPPQGGRSRGGISPVCSSRTPTTPVGRSAGRSLARLVALDPYGEEGHVMRVEALLALGAEERARAAYGAYAQLMRDDLHAEPRAELAARFEKPHARTERSLPREGFATLREVTLHFVDWPGGDPPLLCLHGATSTCYVYGGLAPKLAPDFPTLATDLRGTRFSDKPPPAYTVQQHVEDLVELCTALRLDRPTLVGHHAGGAVRTPPAPRGGA